jgi:hypothetical protein
MLTIFSTLNLGGFKYSKFPVLEGFKSKEIYYFTIFNQILQNFELRK